MQRVIEETVCDRCGNTFDTEPAWKYRGAALLGKAYRLLHMPKQAFSERDCEVLVRLYYVSHYRYIGGEEDGIVDLCDGCKKELADWFNAPRLERD